MTEIDYIRTEIAKFTEPFMAKDLNYPHKHEILGKLVASDEIAVVGHARKATGGRQPKIYKVIELKFGRPKSRREKIEAEQNKRIIAHKGLGMWAAVWPEFFTVPAFQGNVRVIRVLDE